MFQRLVSHNDDIKRLVEKGYAVGFDSNYLVIRDIPYLDQQLHLRTGSFVSKIMFIDQNKVTQDDHQVYFAGSVPYNFEGKPIPNLGGGPVRLPLSENSKDVIVERSFSNKPRKTGRFSDFFEKIESYVSIISGPAMEKYDVNPYTYRIVEQAQEDSVFKFQDTLSSRAEISDLSAKFKDDVIAIIGLGGTGSYVLDFLVKTPVREVRIFDIDPYYVHNVFRSPGRLQSDELGKLKVEVYGSRYENFRNGLKAEPKFIDETSKDDFSDVTFAFVCVDKGTSRAGIIELLVSMKIPFIDVGMGLSRKNGKLKGMARTSYFSTDENQIAKEKEMVPLTDNPDDVYKTNIQIGELNALNASLAVIRYKQLRGFYMESVANYDLLFDISDMKIVGSDLTDNQNDEV
ncbi:ThiF family adenylyltransferase [Dehalobacter sp. TBBPA1]|uniref:ThiF family adenylyltransferase n=1 Tax=Dehalobacter sp. TBBPA1 TaxID=3235037 RepID=UPI0034A544FC